MTSENKRLQEENKKLTINLQQAQTMLVTSGKEVAKKEDENRSFQESISNLNKKIEDLSTLHKKMEENCSINKKTIVQLEKDNAKLKTEIKERETSYQELQNTVAALKEEVCKKEDENKSFRVNVSNLNKNNGELSTLQKKLEEKCSLNSKKIDQLEKENAKLKTEIEVMKTSYKESFQLLQNENINLVASEKKINDENQMIKQEYQKKTNAYLDVFKSSREQVSAVDFYDMIIDVDSLKKLITGWEIQYTPEGEKRYLTFRDQRTCVIGVIGNFNKGKSFVLQKLSDYELPHGYNIQTRGLSVKYPLNLNKCITLLDTAGFELPLKYVDPNLKIESLSDLEQYDQNLIAQMSRDRQLTELFLQKFVIESSNILLAVVGILTYSDQKLLNRMRKFCKSKKMFIIHNLSQFVTKSQVDSYINDTLTKAFHIKPTQYVVIDHEDEKILEQFSLTYFVDSSETTDITHLILANEFSEAGQYYNPSSILFLKNQIKSFTKMTPFPVEEMLKKHLYETSRELMEEESKIDITQISTENNLFRLKSENEILLKKCFVDELGFSKFYGSNYTPNYSYVQTENEFIVAIEICELVEFRVDAVMMEGEYYIFKFSGEKQISSTYLNNNNSKGLIFNNRELGKFVVSFTIPVQSFLLKNYLPESDEQKDGSIILHYGIQVQQPRVYTLHGFKDKK